MHEMLRAGATICPLYSEHMEPSSDLKGVLIGKANHKAWAD
jgi:hypothetical protein